MYDQNLLPQHTLISKTNAHLQTIVQVHYKKNKLKNTLDQFRKQFSINEAIAKIENNSQKKKIFNKYRKETMHTNSIYANKK